MRGKSNVLTKLTDENFGVLIICRKYSNSIHFYMHSPVIPCDQNRLTEDGPEIQSTLAATSAASLP
jgi:hypothetical protein